jgi:hypothetical protein
LQHSNQGGIKNANETNMKVWHILCECKKLKRKLKFYSHFASHA